MDSTWTSQHPQVFIATITPETARAMLGTSKGNRNLAPSKIKEYAGQMIRGSWRLVPNGIGFRPDGSLFDGHHRLTACVNTGVTISAIVLLGAPENAYEVTDTGKTRVYADLLDLPASVAEVLTFASIIFHHGAAYAGVTTDQIKPLKNSRLMQLANDLVSVCNTRRAYMTATPIRLAACIAVMQGQRKEWVWEQYRALAAMDYQAMTPMSQALARQVQISNKNENARVRLSGKTRYDALARGLRVFDEARSTNASVRVNAQTLNSVIESVRETLAVAMQQDDRQSALFLGMA